MQDYIYTGISPNAVGICLWKYAMLIHVIHQVVHVSDIPYAHSDPNLSPFDTSAHSTEYSYLISSKSSLLMPLLSHMPLKIPPFSHNRNGLSSSAIWP